eukprot:1157614-Pelagomonas_calceolata.AAC.4
MLRDAEGTSRAGAAEVRHFEASCCAYLYHLRTLSKDTECRLLRACFLKFLAGAASSKQDATCQEKSGSSSQLLARSSSRAPSA